MATSTGMAPVATATAAFGAGAFVECSNYQGWDTPFCLPRRGSVLKPGSTYYGKCLPYSVPKHIVCLVDRYTVTWDPSYFAEASTPVSVQVRYSDNTGFTTNRTILADAGYSVWAVDEDVLTREGRNGNDLVATLYLMFEQALDNSLEYVPGPEVAISKSAPTYDPLPESEADSHRKTVAIAVPVTVIVVLMALGAVMLWNWNRRRRGFGVGSVEGRRGPKRTSSGSNYGWPEDKSNSVELANIRENWGRVRGTNVFREEIQRQEAMRTS